MDITIVVPAPVLRDDIFRILTKQFTKYSNKQMEYRKCRYIYSIYNNEPVFKYKIIDKNIVYQYSTSNYNAFIKKISNHKSIKELQEYITENKDYIPQIIVDTYFENKPLNIKLVDNIIYINGLEDYYELYSKEHILDIIKLNISFLFGNKFMSEELSIEILENNEICIKYNKLKLEEDKILYALQNINVYDLLTDLNISKTINSS